MVFRQSKNYQKALYFVVVVIVGRVVLLVLVVVFVNAMLLQDKMKIEI